MKKTIILLPALLLVCAAKTQGLYGGLGIGYGLGVARETDQNINTTFTSGGSNLTSNVETVSYSYGQGLNGGLYMGYMLKKNWGFELGASYLKGSKVLITYETHETSLPSNSKTENTSYGSLMRLTPAMRIAFGNGKLGGYAKAGAIISVGGKFIYEHSDKDESPGFTATLYTREEFTGGLGFGACGSLGFTYMFSPKAGIFGELSAYYQDWAPTKGKVLAYDVDGASRLPAMTKREKETEFVDFYTETYPYNDNKPAKALKQYYPFSSVGITIGLHVSLGKTE